jgi:hypothetical protein
MILSFIRVLFGFVLACLAAGLTMVLFVFTPLEVTGMPGDRLSEVGLLTLAAATHSAVFAAPFALIGAVFGEWQRVGGWLYYVLVAIVIAGIGFTAQSWTESIGEASIINSYAVSAFLLTGFVAGMVYWLVAGRYASRGPIEPDIMSPARPAPAPNGPSPRTAA